MLSFHSQPVHVTFTHFLWLLGYLILAHYWPKLRCQDSKSRSRGNRYAHIMHWPRDQPTLNWLIEYNLSPSGEDMYSQMTVFIPALVGACWKLLPHPHPLLTRCAGQRVGSNNMYSSIMAVFTHAIVSVWWKLLPHPCPLLTRCAGQRMGSNNMYSSIMAVFTHAIVSVWWKLLHHPCPLLTRWAGWRVGLNSRPHDNRYPP
jgi:hypothetical protein